MKSISRLKTLLVILSLSLALPVLAMNLQQAMSNLPSAKDQGLVGEQPNGYLGVVKAEGQAAEIVRLINQARREQYQKLAQENGLPLADVEAMAGQKAIERTTSGHVIQVDGKWVKKP